MDGITRETFQDIQDIKTKVSVLFDITVNINEKLERLEKIERKRTFIHNIYSALGGFLGGMAAFLGLNLSKWF